MRKIRKEESAEPMKIYCLTRMREFSETVAKLRVTGDGYIPCGNASFTERTAVTFLTSLASWEALSCKIDLLQVIRLFHGSLRWWRRWFIKYNLNKKILWDKYWKFFWFLQEQFLYKNQRNCFSEILASSAICKSQSTLFQIKWLADGI